MNNKIVEIVQWE